MTNDLDEISRDVLASVEADPPAMDWITNRVHRRRKGRFAAVGAGLAVVLAALTFGLAGQWTELGQRITAADEGEPLPVPDRRAVAPAVRGNFVWPFPARGIDEAELLITAFVRENLGWQSYASDVIEPNDDLGDFVEVAVQGGPIGDTIDIIAQRSDDGGWGIIQADGQSAGEGFSRTAEGPVSISFDGPVGAIGADLTINLADGSTVTHTLEPTGEGLSDPELPGFSVTPGIEDPSTVISVLAVFRDLDGQVLSASGGQFESGEEELDAVEVPAAGAGLDAPNQTPEEAEAMGIVSALTDMSYNQRVNEIEGFEATTGVDVDLGRWIISEPGVPDGADPVIGNKDGTYGRDFIAAFEYNELLLTNHDRTVIMYAIPFPSMPLQSLHQTDDTIWALRVGDGGLPDSVLVRVDLDTFEPTVRVFPIPETDTSWYDELELPYEVTFDDQSLGEILGNGGPIDFVADDSGDAEQPVRLGNNLTTAAVDPETLELQTFD